MACQCDRQVDAMLADHNTRLTRPIMLGGTSFRPMIVTEQVETGRGKKKAVAMFATYCPFCGVKIED